MVRPQCTQRHCYAPTTTCAEGVPDYLSCPLYVQNPQDTQESGPSGVDGLGLVPWVGSTLGVADLPFVAGRAQPFRIGVIGAKNSGKTTLLAATYLFLANGGRVDELALAGSYTLGGWESLAHRLRWFGEIPPNFPEHTASNTAREPGFLHLALGCPGKGARDVLLADSPGEWFEDWAFNVDAEIAKGAVALHAISDAFILVVDSRALAEPETRGEARSGMEALTQRLSSALRDRPVAVVWTKADVAIPPVVREKMREVITRFLPLARHFDFSVLSSAPDESSADAAIPEILSWMFSARLARRLQPPSVEAERNRPVRRFDPFFLLGVG